MRWLPCPDTVYWVKAVRRLSLLLLCPAIKPVKDVQEEKMSDDLTIDVFIYFTEAAAAQAAKWSVASQMDYLAMNAAAHSGSGGGGKSGKNSSSSRTSNVFVWDSLSTRPIPSTASSSYHPEATTTTTPSSGKSLRLPAGTELKFTTPEATAGT